ncbi:hypothetical protein GCM10009555_017180 [Acrocarpospora macrocephala]|uniref:Uncharacterized protein n=1 Tax=Acrocarpospora macrocephala TaxID=150177 RepID=A0A5M3WM44_9ACTN|nr:hypothetical protein Amac_009730 [Acrocarpospora macrocephala]
MTGPAHAKPEGRPCTHRKYLLTCDDYDALLKGFRERCGVCGTDAKATPAGILFIDHDALRGDWAVRGLLCNRCNSSLHHMSHQKAADYLANPWYVSALQARGLRIDAEPEPPEGAVVRVSPQGLMWRRAGGWWRCIGDGRRRGVATWTQLNQRHGPFGIRLMGHVAS